MSNTFSIHQNYLNRSQKHNPLALEQADSANHSKGMDEELDHALAEAEQAVQIAVNLAQAQEQQIAEMCAKGVNTKEAEALLAAYRRGVHLACRRKAELETAAQMREQSS